MVLPEEIYIVIIDEVKWTSTPSQPDLPHLSYLIDLLGSITTYCEATELRYGRNAATI